MSRKTPPPPRRPTSLPPIPTAFAGPAEQARQSGRPRPLDVPERVYTPGAATAPAPVFVPGTATRKQRRIQAKHAAEIRQAGRKAELEERRKEKNRIALERKSANYLPRGGEHGPRQLRSYRSLSVQEHRATSDVLAGAYPFLAEAGLGSDGLYIGKDSWSGAGFVFDPWVLYAAKIITNPNIALFGEIGAGKSALAKSLVWRSLAFGRRAYVPSDTKGEWSGLTKLVGGQVIALGTGQDARLNPLDEGPRSTAWTDEQWRTNVTVRRKNLLRAMIEMTLRRQLRPTETTAVYAAIDTVVAMHSTPTLSHVVDVMYHPPLDVTGSTVAQLIDDGREAAHALARLVHGDLAGLFDGPSTVAFDPSLPMVSIDLSGIGRNDVLLALAQTCAATWMEAVVADPNGGQRWMVYDEAWRSMREKALLLRMQEQWKLARAWGLANLMVMHRTTDLDAVGNEGSQERKLAEGLLDDCGTKILYRQERSTAATTSSALQLTAAEYEHLAALEKGEGLWKIRDRAFMVRHVVTANELRVIDTDSRMGTPA